MNELGVRAIESTPPLSPQAETHPAASNARDASLDNLFPQEEWIELHSQDKLAGTAIVAIMIAIFSLGLLGYLVIALVCAGG